MQRQCDKPVNCGACEGRVAVKRRAYPTGLSTYAVECQVVCLYCGTAGAKESDPVMAIQRWNSMWAPRAGDANPVTRLLYALAERSPWVRMGRGRTKHCAYCGAWRTAGATPEPHSLLCPWAEARRSLNMPGGCDV